ncbi:caspase recruitment domain-containing protein 9 isoform X4 [Falco biarmicus]|uniref:caspase recruitment domain-containing protein 9 isoform X4 n=1 Tax=Falco peregrinus TaxID=8954 RepID=UPI000FFB7518|nr:caspase recruitment domain-containing protein 9 isoform X4 [Falco peregrinus]XP_027665396.1 caspase recruitment domain-containing protein 9 isoform X4 [Falco cherrug]XP_037255865.1 caspase recruitment domain-containing protein 9 isoform X4 [Falco rusticolus]XP_056207074.1 caspase recruitment domain-containing protein 9 isoform X4 [Falco biarmicus]
MLEEDNDETCWNNLENFRVKLISVIDPSRITPYLRQCKVISHDDEEQVLNDPSLVMRKRKAGVLLDILQRTGHKGFEAFLESLELYYPQLYKKITGKEPSRVFSMIIDSAGESGLSQLLMNEIMKLQSTVQEERRKAQELTMWLHAKENTIREMWVRDSLLRKHQERAQKMKEERDSLSKELRKCKDENYNLAMCYAKQSEEKSAALMKNRDLILEIDHLKHSLMKAEDDCKLERKHTMKLKHAIEQRPSHEVMWEIQQEKELLLAKNQELENTLQQVAREQNLENSLSKDTLENDCSQILEERRELMNTIYSLRKELRRAEYAEEKEMLELQCVSLRKDSQMYKKRIEAVLQQMEEVASERDQALLTREQFYMQYSKNLVERDAYRKQVRELGERCDEMQLQLFQKESQLLATEAKLKRLQLELPTPTSDLDDTSSRDSQELTLHGHLDEDTQPTKKDFPEGQDQQFSTRESSLPPKSPSFKGCGLANEELAEKERRRMKDCFERYRRSGLHLVFRKRAMRRVPKDRHHEADWENTTGSDNTDTEGS